MLVDRADILREPFADECLCQPDGGRIFSFVAG